MKWGWGGAFPQRIRTQTRAHMHVRGHSLVANVFTEIVLATATLARETWNKSSTLERRQSNKICGSREETIYRPSLPALSSLLSIYHTQQVAQTTDQACPLVIRRAPSPRDPCGYPLSAVSSPPPHNNISFSLHAVINRSM